MVTLEVCPRGGDDDWPLSAVGVAVKRRVFEGEIQPSRGSVGYKTTTRNKKENNLIAEGSEQEPARLAL